MKHDINNIRQRQHKTPQNCPSCYNVFSTHQLKAFSKMRNQGDTV
jgi:hypothetical protein